MGGISSSVGLISGIDSRSLINQLIQIESRPKQLVQQRILQLQQRQAAYLSINSSLLALRGAAGSFNTDRIFDSNTATSSNQNVLTGTASTNAAVGSYSFIVNRLVTTQQVLSRGFSDRNVTGLGASEFSFEFGGGGVTSETTLGELNGGQGVQRGKIQITDRSGASAEVDLSTAVTVNDVLEKINSAGGVSVTASAEGDRLVIKDTSGGSGSLSIESLGGRKTAENLGIAGSIAGDTLTGSSVRALTSGTALSLLNDGLGVDIRDGSTDLRITTKSGTVLNIDFGRLTQEVLTEDFEGAEAGDPYVEPDPKPDGFVKPKTEIVTKRSRATTLGDIVSIINEAADKAGVNLTAAISGDGKGLVIEDNTGGAGNLIIRSQGSRTTAQDLGIETEEAGIAGSTVEGARLLSGLNSKLVRNLLGGQGISATDMTITDRAGNAHSFSLSASALDGSVSDIIREMNAALSGAGVGVQVGMNRAGNGIALTDTSGGSGNLIVSGDAAEALGIDNDGVGSNTINGGNLQSRWITYSTKLSDLRLGQGIGTGEIRITDSTGTTITANIGSTIETIADLIGFLESRGVDIDVDINESGDGLIIRDTAGGSNPLIIQDVSGSVARNLNIAGTFNEKDGEIKVNGSYERTVKFKPSDTLDDIVRKINEAGVGVSASVINDGSAASPFRISITSRFSGASGRAIIDTKDFDLGITTLTRGDNAVVFYGADDPANGVLLTSTTNTLDRVVTGVTIDLKQASTNPVTLTVSRDTAKMEESINSFVSAFNKALESIDAQTFFQQEGNRRGPLLGDSTAAGIKSRLLSSVQAPAQGVEGRYQRLFEVGLSLGSGNKLNFDVERFRDAMETDPEAVKRLFAASVREPTQPTEISPGITTPNTEETFSSLGVMEQIRRMADAMTNSVDGLLTNRKNTLDTQIRAQNSRIAQMDNQLARRRARLESQFLNMERALAQLQSQQTALGSFGLGFF